MKRSLRTTAGYLVLIAGVAAVLASTWPVQSMPAQAAASNLSYRVSLPVAMSGFAETGPSILGVETWGTESELSTTQALSAAPGLMAGFTRRNSISWAQIEAKRGTYDFTASDQDLLNVVRVSQRPILIVQGTPSWARPDSRYTLGGPFPADYLPDYVRFWKALVARYSKPPYHIHYWEVYNEPDNTLAGPGIEGWLGRFGDAPDQYAQVLRVAYESIKSVDPGATVLFGSLAFDYFDDQADASLVPLERGGAGIFQRDFLDRALAAGAGPYFDALGFHYYNDYEPRWLASRPGLNAIAAKAAVLRDTLRKYGLDKPLYLTEAGFPSATEAQTTSLLPGASGAEDSQARYVIYLTARAMAAGVQSVIWYRLIDDPQATSTNSFVTHGLISGQGSRKPSFAAFQVAARTLGTASFVRVLSPAELGSASAEGYLFQTIQGKELRVLWATASAVVPVTIPGAATLAVTRKDGAVSAMAGGTLLVTPDPVIVTAG